MVWLDTRMCSRIWAAECAERLGYSGSFGSIVTQQHRERLHTGKTFYEFYQYRGRNNPADVFMRAVSGMLREKFFKKLGFKRVAASKKHKKVLGS